MKYYFKWNGVSSDTKGIKLQEMPPIIRPQERVRHVTIPGRGGDVTLTEDSDIYESYIQTIPLAIDNASDVSAAEKWLRGNGNVIFCGQPTLQQQARVINSVEFRKHSKHSNWYEGEVQFYCQPLKEPVTSSTTTVTSSGTTVNNPGDVISRPKFTVTGSGNVTISCGGRTIALIGMPSSGTWVVDSELEWVTSGGTPQQGVFTGQFPRMNPGNNTVLFTGSVTSIVIDGRFRYL